MEPTELLSCRDVSLGYERQSVLTHLSLTIRAGDYLCIVGDNGSGKSTLLRGFWSCCRLRAARSAGRRSWSGAP